MKQQRYLIDRLLTFLCEYEFKDGEHTFKPVRINNADGIYFCSNIGTIISLYHNKWIVKHQILNRKTGYYQVRLSCEGKEKKVYVHRIVALTFVDNNRSEEKTIVHHKDFNPLNNNVSNLVFVTPKEHSKLHNLRE